MRTCTKEQLRQILAEHAKWLNNPDTGRRADLSYTDLSTMDLRGVRLAYADLSHADLSYANLAGADLHDANLPYVSALKANFRNASLESAILNRACFDSANMTNCIMSNAILGMKTDFSHANMTGCSMLGAVGEYANFVRAKLARANLSHAVIPHSDFSEASITDTELMFANLHSSYFVRCAIRGADFSVASLSMATFCRAKIYSMCINGANLAEANFVDVDKLAGIHYDAFTVGYSMVPPSEGEYIAWKKASGFLVKLLIPADAKRSSATTRKCRASKAKVLGIYDMTGKRTDIESVKANYDPCFVYTVGQMVKVNNFDNNRWNECAPGIHHFLTRDEAAAW